MVLTWSPTGGVAVPEPLFRPYHTSIYFAVSLLISSELPETWLIRSTSKLAASARKSPLSAAHCKVETTVLPSASSGAWELFQLLLELVLRPKR